MPDFEYRKLERNRNDPTSAQSYLINQLRTQQYNLEEIINCALDFSQPQLQEKCAYHIPMVLAKNPESIITLTIRMCEWWNNQASFPENYPVGYNALDVTHLRLNEYVDKNPLIVNHLLNLLNRWNGEVDRISYYDEAYQMSASTDQLAENILSEFKMFQNLGDFPSFDDIDYTIVWVHYCGTVYRDKSILLASLLWNTIQKHNLFFSSNQDPDYVQELGYMALGGITNPSERSLFVDKLDFYREREEIISMVNHDIEEDLNLFADAFQSNDLLGLPPTTGYTDWSSNPGIISRAIILLNNRLSLPEIRNIVVAALS